MMDEHETTDVEVLPAFAIASAELDTQITTARAYPRSVKSFQSTILSYSCLDQKTADSCMYALPRKSKDGKQSFIIGPSIRFAELLSSSWGNLRIGSRTLTESVRPNWDKKEKWGYVEVEAGCHDLQTNVVWTKPYKQRIEVAPSKGGVELAVQSAVSRAGRNAVLATVPQALWLPIFEEQVRPLAAGGSKGLADRRAHAVDHFGKLGIEEDRLLEYFPGTPSVLDLDTDQVMQLGIIARQIKEGTTKIEEVFPSSSAKKTASGKEIHVGEGADFLSQAESALSEETTAAVSSMSKVIKHRLDESKTKDDLMEVVEDASMRASTDAWKDAEARSGVGEDISKEKVASIRAFLTELYKAVESEEKSSS